MPGRRGRHRPIHAAPGHHRCIAGQAAFQDFIPADQLATARGKKFLHARGQVGLHGGLVGHTEFMHALLHARGRLPLVLYRLVAADMNVLAWKQRHHFGQYVLKEDKGALFIVEQVVVHAPVMRHHGRRHRAKFGIGRDSRLRVAGHVYLGHDGDVAIGRVAHDIAHLVLRVETTVADRLSCFRVDAGRTRRNAPSADLGQAWIFPDLQSPALVVGQVPLQDIELVQGHCIDEQLDLVRCLHVPRGIEHQAAPGKSRLVFDVLRPQPGRPAPRRVGRCQLQQTGCAVEQAVRLAGGNADGVARHIQHVAFVAGYRCRRVQLEDNRRLGRRRGMRGDRQRQAARRGEAGAEMPGNPFDFRIA